MSKRLLTRRYINDLMRIVGTEKQNKKTTGQKNYETQHNTHGAASKSDCY